MDNKTTNTAVNPFVALFIIIVFGGLFGFKYYFYQQAVNVPKLNHIKASPSGDIFIRLGEELYDYTPSGELNRIINLTELNIADHFGGFDFFSNGDILINRDEFLPNFKDRIDTFRREANTNQSKPKLGLGLQRCDLTTLTCTLFTDQIPMLQSAFDIFIDTITDDVYIADTSRHHIRKLDNNGNVLAEITSDLAFPNQLWLEDDTLWIIDTNHHQIKAVKADTNTFGTLIEEHKTTLFDQHIWPSAFTKVANKWWVSISNNAMADAKIVTYSQHWKKGKSLDLDNNADPISLLTLNNKVLITDANQYALYQFDFEGKRLVDFASENKTAGIQSTLQSNKQKAAQLILWSDYCLWAAIALFIPIFIFALFQAKSDDAKKKEQASLVVDQALPESLSIDGEWLESKAKFKVLQWFSGIAFVFLIISGIGLIITFKDKVTIDLIILMAVVPFIFIIMLPIRTLSRLKIGFFNDHVSIETPEGRLISSPYHEIKWNNRAFVISEWVVPIGHPAHSIFPYERLTELLLPRVLESNKLTEKELRKYQWHSPDGTLKATSLALVLGIIMILVLERESILSFISTNGILS